MIMRFFFETINLHMLSLPVPLIIFRIVLNHPIYIYICFDLRDPVTFLFSSIHFYYLHL